MDRQGGNPKQGSVDPYEFGCERAALIGRDDPSRKAQVPVQPRMPDTPSVGFHPDLEVSFLSPLRDWSDAEVRAIDVSCYNRNSSARLPFLWDGEGKERALISIPSRVGGRGSV